VTFFNTFALSFGLLLVGLALIAAWMFRTAAAPLAAKLGLPRIAALGAPPDRAELIAFVAHDEDKRVDLWLRVEDAPPRAYDIAIDEAMKRLLRDARDRMEHGGRVMLVKHAEHADKKAEHQGGFSQQPADHAYAIDESAFALPTKGSGERAGN
jgi:hypothetical protein